MLLEAHNVSRAFGGFLALSDASLSVRQGEIVGLIGPNGAGTLLGPLLGAAILVPLGTATNTWLGGGGSGVTFIVYGGIIVLIARFEPGGLLELWHRRLAPRLTRILKPRHAA